MADRNCVCGWTTQAPTEQESERIQEAHWFGHVVAFSIEIENSTQNGSDR